MNEMCFKSALCSHRVVVYYFHSMTNRTDIFFSYSYGQPQQRPASADMSNMNSKINIDYAYLEKLLGAKIPEVKPTYKIQLEEIHDLDDVLNDKTSFPVPLSSSSKLKRSAQKSNVMNMHFGM